MLRVAFVLFAFTAVGFAQESDDPERLAELRSKLASAEQKAKESQGTGVAAYQLGKHLLDRGVVAEAEALLDRALATLEKTNKDSLDATLTRAQLARLYNSTNRKDRAKGLEDKVRSALKDNQSYVARQVLAMFAKPIPGTAPGNVQTVSNYAQSPAKKSSEESKAKTEAPKAAPPKSNSVAEKEKKLRENLAAAEKALGKNNKDSLLAAQELGVHLADQGKLAEAETQLRRALEGLQQPPLGLGVEHGRALVELSRALRLAGKADVARDNGATGVAILEKVLGKDHPSIAEAKKRTEAPAATAAKKEEPSSKSKATTEVAKKQPEKAPSSSTGNAPAAQTTAVPNTPPVTGSASVTNGALDPAWAKEFRWRTIGPTAMGGRVVDLAVVENDPTIWYVASASGGLFKTTNAGTTFTATFDREATVSIGDVCVAPSNPDVVWVGTGESNARNSASWGDGVYRSIDGGKTWQNMGLRESFQIGKILIHPTNPDVVYLGALGRLWGENAERGVFKTIDGGKTWEKVLFIDDKTGCIDMIMSPSDPETILAAMYERKRDNTDDNDPIKRWGPGSGIYKTTDGGRKWAKLSKGLPTVPMGRVGFSWYLKDPKVVYAIIETERSGDDPTRPQTRRPQQAAGSTTPEPASESGESPPLTASPTRPAGAPAQTAASQERPTRSGPGSGYMGIQGENAPSGARMTTVTPDGPAARAGLRNEDVISAIDGKTIKSYDELINALQEKAAGDKLALTVARGPEQVKIEVTLAPRPAVFAGGRGAPPGKPFGTSLGGQVPNVQDRQGPEGYQTGGVFRSADGGESWTRINSLTPRPFYFSKLRVDPHDENNIYVLGISLHTSKNGGKTFDADGGRQVHSDHHAMWINPRDPRHIVLGCDGGLYVTHDKMQTWDFLGHLPMSQFYHVAVDTRKPYSVYGGLQDNQSWGAPSATRRRNGPSVSDWINLGGGDGFVCAVDPTDPDIVYYESQNGGMVRVNLKSGDFASLRPAAAEGRRYRFNWKTPFILSNHNPRIFYAAGNYVFRSVNRGADLKVISPQISNSNRGTGTALAESPLDPNVLYVGTDDGALWVTQDGGQKWTNLKDNLKNLVPAGFWVDTLECSRFAAGRVYAALDCHRADNEHPFPVVSEDFGKTWKSLRGNLPSGSTRTLREDRENQNLLYCGTEFGLWASINRGANWTKLTGLPTVAVHEVAQPTTAEELVVATHGRGIWIMELAPLRQTTKEVAAADATLFKPALAHLWNVRLAGSNYGHRRFNGENPTSDAVVYYALRRKAEKVSLKVVDIEGKTIRELTAPKGAGLQRVLWDRRRAVNPIQGAVGVLAGPQRGQVVGGGGGGRGRGRPTPFVDPGTYRVVLTVDGKEFASALKIEPDPDAPITAAALGELLEFLEGKEEELEGDVVR